MAHSTPACARKHHSLAEAREIAAHMNPEKALLLSIPRRPPPVADRLGNQARARAEHLAWARRSAREALVEALVRHAVRYYGDDDPLPWVSDRLRDLARAIRQFDAAANEGRDG